MSLGFFGEWGAAAECRAARLWKEASRPARASPTHDCSPCRWLRSRSSPVRAEAGEGMRKESRDTSPASNRQAPNDVGEASACYSTRPPSRPIQVLRCSAEPHILPAQRRSSREGGHVVRQTLRLLLASLPLDAHQTTVVEQQTSADDNQQHTTVIRHNTHVNLIESMPDTQERASSRASIAVQASTVDVSTVKSNAPSSRTSETGTAIDSDVCDECRGDAWRDGVRALRDAHIRMARRHLRLLHTLSRALDNPPTMRRLTHKTRTPL